MTLSKHVEKLDKYYARLENGKAQEIKPAHVYKVISKLKAKESALTEEYKQAVKDTKRERLQHKQLVLQEQIKRAEWLLAQIEATMD